MRKHVKNFLYASKSHFWEKLCKNHWKKYTYLQMTVLYTEYDAVSTVC